MKFEDWAELNERAKSCGIGNDRSLDQLLHIIQFKEVVKSGHRRTMRELTLGRRISRRLSSSA